MRHILREKCSLALGKIFWTTWPLASVGYKHFPKGHANKNWVRYWTDGEDMTFRIVNDLFVREDIPVTLEVREAASGDREEL